MSNSRRFKRNLLKQTELVLFPNDILDIQCKKVNEDLIGSDDLYEVYRKMRYVCNKHNGLAISANQIGFDMRMFYVSVPLEGEAVFINPYIVNKSGRVEDQEGCLSIPGYQFNISRSERIVVEWISHRGEVFSSSFSGLVARVIQHEIDHLNGTLIIDHISYKESEDFIEKYFATEGENNG